MDARLNGMNGLAVSERLPPTLRDLIMANSNATGDRRERELARTRRGGLCGNARASQRQRDRAGTAGRALGRRRDVLRYRGEVQRRRPHLPDRRGGRSATFFARNFGAKPRIAVRFDREDWYFFHPGDLYVTDGGNYRVKKETALADGTDFDEFVGHSEKVTLTRWATTAPTRACWTCCRPSSAAISTRRKPRQCWSSGSQAFDYWVLLPTSSASSTRRSRDGERRILVAQSR